MFEKIGVILGAVISILTVIAFIFGAYLHLDSKFAEEEKVEEVKLNVEKVEKRLDFKIVKDKFQAVQERMWNLEDRHGGRDLEGADQSVKEEYRNLQVQQKELKEELKEL